MAPDRLSPCRNMAWKQESFYDHLSPESLLKATRELNEVPEETTSCIERLRKDALDSQKGKGDDEALHLHRIEEDAFLLRFLRNKKFHRNECLKKYLSYCEFRANNQDLFGDLDISKVRHVYDAGAFCLLEPRLKNGCRVLVDRVNLNAVNLYDVMGAGYLLLDKLLEDPENQVNGIMLIRDWTGVGVADTVRLQLFMRKEMSKFVGMFQDAVPARFKALWNFNAPWFVAMLFKLITPFLSEKVTSRVQFLDDDFSPLHELIDQEQLPEELGGLLPPMDATHTLKLLGLSET